MTPKTVHASAVLIGARAVLIRGPSGSGKSQLALGLIEAARGGALAFARLVADDRVHLETANGRLLARPAAALAGLIEVRGIGLMRLAYEPCAVDGFVDGLGDGGRRHLSMQPGWAPPAHWRLINHSARRFRAPSAVAGRASPAIWPAEYRASEFAIPQRNSRRISTKMPLALGLRMVNMNSLSCGAPGTRPRGVP
jgi:hypothetical protein